MRIVIVSHGYGTREWMKLLDAVAEEHDLTLLTPPSLATPIFGTIEAPSSSQVHVHVNRTRRITPSGHFVFLPQWRAWRRLRPDVVHFEYDPWTPEFWSVALPFLILHPRTPWVLNVKKNTRHVPAGPAGWLERSLTWLGMRKVRRILAVSQLAADVYTQLGYGSVPAEIVAPLPVDGEVFAPSATASPPRPFTIGFVGQVGDHKGVPTLVEAVRLLRADGGDARLVVTGPALDEGLVAELRTIEWVDVTGSIPTSAIPEHLHSFDVFAMPSRILPDHQEHDGQALLEAMASGLPCVGSTSGIIPELLPAAWVVAPDDAPALAARLAELQEDPEKRARLGDELRRVALNRAGLVTLARRRIDNYETVVHG